MGEATEVALRVLAEKVGLAGYANMPGALAHLSRRERATFCNDYWQHEYHRVPKAALLNTQKPTMLSACMISKTLRCMHLRW